MEFRTLKASEIEIRLSRVNGNTGAFLLYKDSRCDMRLLDETVGAENWQRKHYECKGNLFCSVGIKCGDEWTWKDDAGSESNVEKEKGEASDSFKRACTNWGIGRELYTAPYIAVEAKKDENIKNLRLKIKDIEYNKDREISKLVIVDNKSNIRYTYPYKPSNKQSPQKSDESKPQNQGQSKTRDILDELKKSLAKYQKATRLTIAEVTYAIKNDTDVDITQSMSEQDVLKAKSWLDKMIGAIQHGT